MLGLIPLEAGIGILLYIGIIIVAQSFQETPKEHAPAVALGIVPALAAWGLIDGGDRAPGRGQIALSSRDGANSARKRGDSRHDFLAARVYIYLDDSCGHRRGVDREAVRDAPGFGLWPPRSSPPSESFTPTISPPAALPAVSD